MKILVTGATGYIGSHFCAEALLQGHELVMVDNLSNSSTDVLQHIEKLSSKPCNFTQLDICDFEQLDAFLQNNQGIEAVVHFAGKKSVDDSVREPLITYNNNVSGSLSLLKAMEHAGIKQIIFSSTASVYGESKEYFYDEDKPIRPKTPYGKSKYMVEEMLHDYALACKDFAAISLRYFNAAGAHPSGILGESLTNKTKNVFPQLMKVAKGQMDCLTIFGSDYPTHDKTAIRDYIHVLDLVNAHLSALDYLATHKGFDAFNLGCSSGYSVLDLVHQAEKIVGFSIPYEFMPRREGDLAVVIADATKAKQKLGWTAKESLGSMIQDSWRYAQRQ